LAGAAKTATSSKQSLAKKGTLFLFDEPTTGLHFDDIAKLMRALRKLLEGGHSLIVIEHNLDVIRASDWLIDLGPEGGDAGGYVVAEGMPEDVRNHATSHTALALREYAEAMGELGGLLKTSEVANSSGDRVTPGASYSDKKSLPGATRSPAELAEQNSIRIVNAKEHNLKNLSVNIPRGQFNVITGVSGSGKSTLAFDILFNEGQRRYLESPTPTHAALCNQPAGQK
jgi:excinuclease ABC subunit A